ncbi:hypothetical protein DSECCO2_517210 [anaerobic digester metagenome]
MDILLAGDCLFGISPGVGRIQESSQPDPVSGRKGGDAGTYFVNRTGSVKTRGKGQRRREKSIGAGHDVGFIGIDAGMFQPDSDLAGLGDRFWKVLQDHGILNGILVDADCFHGFSLLCNFSIFSIQ